MRDFDIRTFAGVRALWVRFRAIKQDPRQERPAARGSGDWACLGDVPDTKWSPIKWYVRLAQLHGAARDPCSPMFVDKSDATRPLLYHFVARKAAPATIAKSSFKLRAAVDAFRGVPQGRAAGAWDEHAACMDRSRDRYS